MFNNPDLEFSPIIARPSFLAGFASLCDWAGALNIYTQYSSEEEADAAALRFDWRAIGGDMAAAIAQFRESIHVKETQKR